MECSTVSKRFGRNQRRRMRENLALAAQREAGLARDLRYVGDRAEDLQSRMLDWARIIHHHLGDEHPFNEKIVERVEKRVPELAERRRFMPLDRTPAWQSLGKLMTYGEVAREFLETVTHLVEMKPDVISMGVHLIVRAPDKSAAYMIDDRALYPGRRDPRFVRFLADEIARKLAHYMNVDMRP